MVAEPTGGWGKLGHTTLCRLAKVAAANAGKEAADVITEYLQGLSVILRKAHASSVLRRCGGSSPRTPPTLASEVLDGFDGQ